MSGEGDDIIAILMRQVNEANARVAKAEEQREKAEARAERADATIREAFHMMAEITTLNGSNVQTSWARLIGCVTNNGSPEITTNGDSLESAHTAAENLANVSPYLDTVIQTQIRVPQDVDWFIPNGEGWLCDYKYVDKSDGSMVLKLVPRNTTLGRVLVYPASALFQSGSRTRLFRSDPRYGHVNNFYRGLSNSSYRQLAMTDGSWVVIAMNQWGDLDRMFCTSASFGDTKAYVRMPTTFNLGQEIPLQDIKVNSLKTAQERFPGIIGTNETLHAYA